MPLTPEPTDDVATFPFATARVSVVIPTHLRPHLLERAVCSVLAQTRAPVETIVVDDADDRQTADTVRRLRTVHGLTPAQLRYETHESSGASASRNHGVHVARGDAIALLDDDDYWAPDYLAGAMSLLASSGANAVVTWRRGAGDEPVRRYPNPTEGLAVQDVIVRNPGVVGSNICIRRDTYLELGGFDEDLPVSNDIDFFVRFLQGGCRYRVLHEPLVFVGGADGRRLTDPDRRRIAGLRAYARKHQEVLSRPQRLEMRRRIARAAFRQAQRDHTSRSIRRVLAGVGFLALTRPRDVGGIGRVAARLNGAARPFARRADRGHSTNALRPDVSGRQVTGAQR